QTRQRRSRRSAPPPRSSGGSHGQPSEWSGSWKPPRRLWRRLLVPDVPSNCFQLVSSTPENGFIPVSDARSGPAGVAGLQGIFEPRNSGAVGETRGRFSTPRGAGKGVKIPCLAPLGALR